MADNTFQSTRTLKDILGEPVARRQPEPRRLILGPCVVNVTTKVNPATNQVVPHPWLWAMDTEPFIDEVARDVFQTIEVEGVEDETVMKVLQSITPEHLEEIQNRAIERALKEDSVRKLTTIPLNQATSHFHRRVVRGIPGVDQDVQAQQAIVQQRLQQQYQNQVNPETVEAEEGVETQRTF